MVGGSGGGADWQVRSGSGGGGGLSEVVRGGIRGVVVSGAGAGGGGVKCRCGCRLCG